jgi:predicted RNA-binding Zn-ribbon protein involved in translation (DUF1610 family)
MFRKKLLGALPTKQRTTPLNEYKWTLEAEITDITKEKTLIINTYLKNNQDINYRAFITKDNYITQDFQGSDSGTWRTGRLAHYLNVDWWCRDAKRVFIEKEYKDIITKFIGIQDDDVMNVVSKFQDRLLDAETLRKEKRITDPIDRKMEEIKELPKDWNEWLENDVFIKSRYIYYQYKNRVNLQGYCTHCKKNVTVYKPKHNSEGICPKCGANIIYKSIGKSTKVQDEKRVAVFQKTSDGFVVRYFYLSKSYGKNYKSPYMGVHESYRDFYNENLQIDTYEYSLFKNKYMRWNRGGKDHYSNASYNVYPYNITSAIKDTKLQYSEVETLAGNKIDFSINIDAFIRNYKNGAVYLEHFIKVGLFNLANDFSNRNISENDINQSGKSLNAVLGIQNDDIKILIKANVTLDGLRLFKTSREQGKRLTAEQLIEIIDNYDVYKFEKIFKYVPIIKALRYLREQPDYIGEKEIFYSDYLDSCVKLKQDMKNTFVLFPKYLRKAHDVNVDLINATDNKEKYKIHNAKYMSIKQMNRELNDLYFYEDSKFLIRAPMDAAEIVKEGQSLHHCVGGGGYSERMANKSIAILFLRDKENPDVSYYTLEINRETNRIVQSHGYRDKDSDKNRIAEFIKKFTKNKLNRIILNKEAV